jgi:hypothetical protein
MANNAAGSIKTVSIKSRLFSVAGDVDAKLNLGGRENEVQPNGDGTVCIVQTVSASDISGLKLRISDTRRDQEFLAEVQGLADVVPITLTKASGLTYRGKMQIVGKIEVSTKDQTAEIQLSGEPLKLEQQ